MSHNCEKDVSSNDARTTPVTPSSSTPATASLDTTRRKSTAPSSAPTHADAPATCKDVGGDVQAIEPLVECMSGECGNGREPERDPERRPQCPALERRCCCEQCDHQRRDEPGAERRSVPRGEADAVDLVGCADGGEHARGGEDDRDALLVRRARDEREQSDADGAEHSGEEEPARDDRPAVGPVAAAVRPATGGGRPTPTPNAITPDSRWPSSEMIDQRTE